MNSNSMSPVRTAVCSVALGFLVGSGAMFAQDQPSGPPPADTQQQSAPANGQWRRAGDPPPAQSEQATPPAEAAAPAEAAPRATMDPNYSQGPPPAPYPSQQNPNQPYPNQQNPNQPYPSQPYPGQRYGSQPPAGYYNRGPIPAKLTIKPGTYVTVRLNQGLSSDRNQVGDGFAATLAKPVVVDGVVVADRGQTVGGKVVEARKAGRVEGVSRLAVQLTDLTLSDGQPVPIQTQLFSRNGPTSVGRDVGAVGATTATGAMIGAAAGWGTGAAIGAGAGALVGIVGVLVTRGHPTLLYPEQILTFRVEAPVTVSTEGASQAFRWVSPNDYERPYDVQNRTRPPNGAYYGYNYPYPYAYPYGYGYGYPYYWGPGIGFYWGRGYWGRGWRR
jgi:hypothetical protein